MIHSLLLSRWIYGGWSRADQLSIIEELITYPEAVEVIWDLGNYRVFINKDSDFARLSEVGDPIVYNEFACPGDMIIKNSRKFTSITVKWH